MLRKLTSRYLVPPLPYVRPRPAQRRGLFTTESDLLSSLLHAESEAPSYLVRAVEATPLGGAFLRPQPPYRWPLPSMLARHFGEGPMRFINVAAPMRAHEAAPGPIRQRKRRRPAVLAPGAALDRMLIDGYVAQP